MYICTYHTLYCIYYRETLVQMVLMVTKDQVERLVQMEGLDHKDHKDLK